MPGFPQSVGYPQTVGYPQPFTPLPGGMPARIVINAPPAGETLTLRPEDGYQQPVVRPGTASKRQQIVARVTAALLTTVARTTRRV
ncbi:hypothetical protein FRC17_009966 [Serendipita sp. 399]|nr:hypothetical protein FRC17_009966 [Serendipita sp. 399]